MGRPTQKDVARRAGVSRSTVSYVLNDQTDQKIPISPETRQRVMDAMAELSYEPDARAQSLRRGSTKTIGVLFPILQNPFFWELLLGISSEAQDAGYGIQVARHPLDDVQINQSLRQLTQQRVGGLILIGADKLWPSPVTKQLSEFGRPIVEITSDESDFDHVVHGYAEGTRLLMSHLFELGHRRIGFVYGVLDQIQGLDRLLTYEQVLQEAGMLLDEDLIRRCGGTLEDGYQATRLLLSQSDRPTALLVINDLLAMAAIRAAADLGLSIPGDISIASFDDIPLASFSVPRLTTVSGQTVQSGRDAVKLLLKRMSEPDHPHEVIVARTQLIIRESTGPVSKPFSTRSS